MIRFAILVIALLVTPTFVLALDQSDAGVYAIVRTDGHVTNKLLRLLNTDSRWKIEDQNPDGSWTDVTCEAKCVLVESSTADVERFLGKLPKTAPAECIHNTAFAFCRTSDQKKSGARDYFLVGLTKKKPIVVELAPQSSTNNEAWRDQQGRPAADTDDRKSVDGFGGWVVVTSDANWKEKWETPSDTTPSFTLAKNIRRDEQIFVLTFLANPPLSTDGRAEVMCDIEIIKPNGEPSTHQENVACFKASTIDPRLTYLSAAVIEFTSDQDDPSGEWSVRITLRDTVRGVALPLQTSFVLADN
ncbi:MAG: hypothetical protein ABW049_04750 [Spongiibacteraceae bacterium]